MNSCHDEIKIPENIDVNHLHAAETYLNLFTSGDVSSEVVFLTLELQVMLQRPPTMSEIAQRILDTKICACTDLLPRSKVIECLITLLQWNMNIWECSVILDIYNYYITNSTYPTVDEFFAYVSAQERMILDSEAYSLAESVKIGVEIGSYLQVGKPTDETCYLCQEDFDKSSSITFYKLPCTHEFHKTDCLADQNIKKWFDEHVNCPKCKIDLRTLGAIEKPYQHIEEPAPTPIVEDLDFPDDEIFDEWGNQIVNSSDEQFM